MTETTTDIDPTAAPAGDADEPSLRVAVERLPASRVRLRIEAPPSDVEAAVGHALRHLGGRVRLPGFRPGKAPAAVVERALGWPAIQSEAVETLVPSVYRRALQQERLAVVDDPQLDLGTLERGQPFTITATVTVRPEVDLGDYLSTRVEETHTTVGDEQVDEAIEEARRRFGELVDVDRPAQAGDVLRATLVMRHGDEVLGGEAEERDVELDRGRVLPGLVDGLLGLAAGDTHTLAITLPDDYAREELRGAEVSVEAAVAVVRERVLPPLDDDLARKDGHAETLEGMRAWYGERLREIAERNDSEHFEGVVLDRLRDTAVVEVPEVMVEREIDRQLRDLEMRLAGSGLRLDRYLEYTGETAESVRASRREPALQRVRLELALDALAEAEGIEIDESDVEREERSVIGERKLTAEQRRRVHMAAHRDLLLRAAGQRALEIARGQA